MRILFLLTLSLFISNSLFAAEIYDVDRKDVIIQADDDEVYQVGDYLFAMSPKGKRKGMIKIMRDRGTLYDGKVIYGKVKVGYAIKTMTEKEKKKAFAFIRKKKSGKKKKKSGGKKKSKKGALAEELAEVEDSWPPEEPEEDSYEPQELNERQYNISFDLAPIGGETINSPFFNGAIEYKLIPSLTVGVSVLFGDTTPDGQGPAGGNPTISYQGFGATAFYGLGNDVLGTGYFASAYVYYVKEDWSVTPQFPGFSETAFMAGGIGGYQYFFSDSLKGLNVRAGVKVNFSSLGQNVVANGFTYSRSTAATGLGFGPYLAVGYGF